jgi:GH24 family phage-related lysozyme (muramidase)
MAKNPWIEKFERASQPKSYFGRENTMRSTVLPALLDFSKSNEGLCTWMYLDTHKDADGTFNPLVTTGIGNLIDPISLVLGLEWFKPDGSRASQQEISDEWQHVKSLTNLALEGGYAFKNVTSLRLSDEGLQNLFASTANTFESELKNIIPNWGEVPADAQLAMLGMCWAMGAGNFATFHKFIAAVKNNDFRTAAIESKISNATAQRNAAQALMLNNAAIVVENGLDPEPVYYPAVLNSSSSNAMRTTVPDLPAYTTTASTVGKRLLVVGTLAALAFGAYRYRNEISKTVHRITTPHRLRSNG